MPADPCRRRSLLDKTNLDLAHDRKPEDLESVAILELQLVSGPFSLNLEREPGIRFEKLLSPKPEPAFRFSSAFEQNGHKKCFHQRNECAKELDSRDGYDKKCMQNSASGSDSGSAFETASSLPNTELEFQVQFRSLPNPNPERGVQFVGQSEYYSQQPESSISESFYRKCVQQGVKDVYTQHRIQLLLSRFQEIKKDEPDRADDDIEQELVQWAVDNRDNICSAFLMIKGFDPTRDTPVEILRTILLGVHYVEAPHSQTLTMHTSVAATH
ncbi:hypothetical protein B0H13DRAFT_1864131 [Mycena leptocephala]|nr:hypothetical protein B0H13DRAFT_1864131 [Mycena leptocephala]